MSRHPTHTTHVHIAARFDVVSEAGDVSHSNRRPWSVRRSQDALGGGDGSATPTTLDALA